jgi:RNA polymerase sigma factor (sigma-70 family)
LLTTAQPILLPRERVSTWALIARSDHRIDRLSQRSIANYDAPSKRAGERLKLDATLDRQDLADALQRVATGDQVALKIVYQRTSAKLFGICLRILGDASEAEDALQDIYVTVWRRAGAFDPKRGVSPITWLATLARNRAIDRLRASKGHLSRPIEAAAEAPDAAPLADATLEQAEAYGRIDACMDELEPQAAAYVRAAFFDGHTYMSLAEAAGAPLGTMKSWIRRALARLRSCLER